MGKKNEGTTFEATGEIWDKPSTERVAWNKLSQKKLEDVVTTSHPTPEINQGEEIRKALPIDQKDSGRARLAAMNAQVSTLKSTQTTKKK